MENEYRERPEENPMDAVSGKSPKQTYSTDTPDGDAQKKSEKSGKQKDQKAASTAKPRKQNLLVQILNGDILTRDFVLNNLSFIFFILLLSLLMVAKGYYGKQLQKDINDLQADVDVKTAEYIENKAKLEESTSRYRLVQKLEKRGLKETVDPAKVIRLKRDGE